MKKYFPLYLLIVLSLQSCLVATRLQSSSIDAVVFHPWQIVQQNMPREKHTRRFTPRIWQIMRMEKILRNNTASMDSLNYRFPRVANQLYQYRRQYMGYIDENGHKIICMNCFTVDWEDDPFEFYDWRWVWVKVFDGGEDFWGARFDVTTGKFIGIYVNGYA